MVEAVVDVIKMVKQAQSERDVKLKMIDRLEDDVNHLTQKATIYVSFLKAVRDILDDPAAQREIEEFLDELEETS
jgi:hypothetical protein